MHIQEGVLGAPVLLAGGAATAAGTVIGLWRMDYERIPEAGVLSAVFFVASLMRFPLGPSSAHPLVVGLCGLVLGWSVFPAILTALFLQAVLFGFGGLTTLGVNGVNFALPAVLCYYLLIGPVRRVQGRKTSFLLGALAGGLGMSAACLMFSTELYLSGKEFTGTVYAVVIAHLVVLPVECLVTGSAVSAIKKLEPELLGGYR